MLGEVHAGTSGERAHHKAEAQFECRESMVTRWASCDERRSRRPVESTQRFTRLNRDSQTLEASSGPSVPSVSHRTPPSTNQWWLVGCCSVAL